MERYHRTLGSNLKQGGIHEPDWPTETKTPCRVCQRADGAGTGPERAGHPPPVRGLSATDPGRLHPAGPGDAGSPGQPALAGSGADQPVDPGSPARRSPRACGLRTGGLPLLSGPLAARGGGCSAALRPAHRTGAASPYSDDARAERTDVGLPGAQRFRDAGPPGAKDAGPQRRRAGAGRPDLHPEHMAAGGILLCGSPLLSHLLKPKIPTGHVGRPVLDRTGRSAGRHLEAVGRVPAGGQLFPAE